MAISFGENSKSPFAKVWKVEPQSNYVKAQISTSRKNKSGEYENSSWFASFVGNCVDKARELKRGDTIKITAGQISVTKKDDKSYTNVVIFGFEEPDFENESKPVQKKETKKKQELEYEDSDDESLPF